MRIEFADKARGLELRPLDDGAVILEEEDFAQHDKALFSPHLLWRIRRAGEGRVTMPTLVLPFIEGKAPQVVASIDSELGQVVLRWQMDEEQGTDALSFTPGATTAATFTRDGQAPEGEELLIDASATARGGDGVASGVAAAMGRLRSVVGVSSKAMDERALRRRRRLRRMVVGIEAFEGEGDAGLGREFLEQLVSFADLDPDDSVLELGCGAGHVARALLHYLRYGSYMGLDPSAESVAWCSGKLTPRNPRFTFARWDAAQALPCKDESLDFVLTTTSCTPELARVLRDGGAVFLTTTLDGDGGENAVDHTAGVPRLTVDRTARGALSGLHPQPDIVVLRRGC